MHGGARDLEAEVMGVSGGTIKEILKVLGLLETASVNHMANCKFAGAVS